MTTAGKTHKSTNTKLRQTHVSYTHNATCRNQQTQDVHNQKGKEIQKESLGDGHFT